MFRMFRMDVQDTYLYCINKFFRAIDSITTSLKPEFMLVKTSQQKNISPTNTHKAIVKFVLVGLRPPEPSSAP